MTGSLTLLLAVHCHQPVGNFDFVVEQAYRDAYEPFLRVLERHPAIHLSLHYSGCLLEWLEERHPEFIERIRAMVARGQVELLSSGYYEPILPVIPEEDRQGQLACMRRKLREAFGEEPSGAWLTERVWEPDLPRTLSTAGLRYTILDANQFRTAAPYLPRALQVQDKTAWDLLGCYLTDYEGCHTVVFPASNRLRYWIPFRPVSQTLRWFRRLADQLDRPVALTFADDGEKFGFWPTTHDVVYRAGWLEQFCVALEREQAWLRTKTCREYLEAMGPEGRVVIPSGSYEELLGWSGGNFRNFFIKYPEANAMYHKMLRVSGRLRAVTADRAAHAAVVGAANGGASNDTRRELTEEATTALYAGQCNCAYWHGIFGGLYLGHLRRAVYRQLIAADDALNRLSGETTRCDLVDADGDGHAEVTVTTPAMHLVIDPQEGGAITEWSLFGSRLNLLDTLTRREEPYHAMIRTARRPLGKRATPRPRTLDLHALLGAKDDGLASSLSYDRVRRVSFLDASVNRLPTLKELTDASWADGGLCGPGGAFEPQVIDNTDTIDVRLVRRLGSGIVRKSIRVWKRQPMMECEYELIDRPAERPPSGWSRSGGRGGRLPPAAILAFNLSLRDERWLTAGERHEARAFDVCEPSTGVLLRVSLEPAAVLQHVPIHTVSESEGGLERTYQGLGLAFGWIVGDARSWSCRMRWTVEESSPVRARPVAAVAAAE